MVRHSGDDMNRTNAAWKQYENEQKHTVNLSSDKNFEKSSNSLIVKMIINTITRGNKYKLLNQSFHYDVRKHSFTPRIVNTWNSLPDYVVNVDSVEAFKKV